MPKKFALGAALRRVDPAPAGAVLDRIFAAVREPGFLRIVTVNAEFLAAARDDPDFAAAIGAPGAVWLPDGSGIRWAASFWKKSAGRNFFVRVFWFVFLGAGLVFWPKKTRDPIPAEVPGSALVPGILARAAREKVPVFLVGRGDGLASENEISTAVAEKFPGLVFLTDFRARGAAVPADLPDKIADFGGVVFVATGAPSQEILLASAGLRGGSPGTVGVGVGSSLDRLAGRQPADPRWARATGTLWLVRFFREILASGRTPGEKIRRVRRIFRAFPGFAVWAFFAAGREN